MINIRFELALTLDKQSVILTPASALFLKINNGKPPKTSPKEPGVNIRDDIAKRDFKWDYKSCSIVYEDVTNFDDCLVQLIKLLDETSK